MRLTIISEPPIIPGREIERECRTLYALTIADAIRVIYAAQKRLERLERLASPERTALEACLRRAGHPEWS